jgi:hypothetical protein
MRKFIKIKRRKFNKSSIALFFELLKMFFIKKLVLSFVTFVSISQINAVCLKKTTNSLPQCPIVQVQQEFEASKVNC